MATDKKLYSYLKKYAEKKLRRMAFEILENNIDEKEIILAGIRESGSVVAKVIQKNTWRNIFYENRTHHDYT